MAKEQNEKLYKTLFHKKREEKQELDTTTDEEYLNIQDQKRNLMMYMKIY